jgi:beta-mannosidase
MVRTVPLDGTDWQMRGFVGLEAALTAARTGWDDGPGWLPATVPGTVLADLWRAGEVPDPYVERNSLLVEWVPERTWVYRRRVDAGTLGGGPDGGAPKTPGAVRTWLAFDGIDHAAHVYLDGDLIGRHEGMFVPFEIDLGERLHALGEHVLAVVVEPAPDTEPQTGRTSRVRIHKSRMTYGWDFCPRMIHQGIWQPVHLQLVGQARIRDVWARPILSDDLRRARVTVAVALDLAAAGRVEIEAVLAGFPDAITAAARAIDAGAGRSDTELELEVDEPPLWWPNGLGSSPVGRVIVRVTGPDGAVDERAVPIGFRRVELIPNEGAPPDARRYTFVVNGRRLYVKGWNWVPHVVFHGVPRPDRIDHLVRLAANANVNLLRVWGGGLIETPAFYEACDRAGLMVWQEFIQSSSGVEDTPSDDPDFVALMRAEAEAIVPLRRNHPSLVLWCGGNELQGPTGPLDDTAPVLGALSDIVHRLDPDRHWLPTSPTGPVFHNRLDVIAARPDDLHDVHGPWEHQGLTGQYELSNRGTSLFSSEFGVEGMTNRRSHEALIPEARRWPATRANPVYRHLGDWWINETHVQACFGEHIEDLETLRRASQHLQADGLRYAIEANRRRAPRNSGSIPWQFNEPYPFAWSTCAVDHRGDPKAAWFAVRRAYAPIAVAAAFDRAALDRAPETEATIWAWTDDERVSGWLSAAFIAVDGEPLAEAGWEVDLGPERPLRAGVLRTVFDATPPNVVLLDLRLTDVAGAVRAANRYAFSGTADLGPLLDLARARLEVATERDDNTWRVRLTHVAGPAALGLTLVDDRPAAEPGWAEVGDSWFDLLPGEARTIDVEWAGAPQNGRRLTIGGWNVELLVVA